MYKLGMGKLTLRKQRTRFYEISNTIRKHNLSS